MVAMRRGEREGQRSKRQIHTLQVLTLDTQRVGVGGGATTKRPLLTMGGSGDADRPRSSAMKSDEEEREKVKGRKEHLPTWLVTLSASPPTPHWRMTPSARSSAATSRHPSALLP